MRSAGFVTAVDGLKIGLVVWLGFVTTVSSPNALFESHQRNKLYMINTGYQLVCYVVMGAILGVGGKAAMVVGLQAIPVACRR